MKFIDVRKTLTQYIPRYFHDARLQYWLDRRDIQLYDGITRFTIRSRSWDMSISILYFPSFWFRVPRGCVFSDFIRSELGWIWESGFGLFEDAKLAHSCMFRTCEIQLYLFFTNRGWVKKPSTILGPFLFQKVIINFEIVKCLDWAS